MYMCVCVCVCFCRSPVHTIYIPLTHARINSGSWTPLSHPPIHTYTLKHTHGSNTHIEYTYIQRLVAAFTHTHFNTHIHT